MIGIYKIQNLVNGKVYIGQTVNILTRHNYHIARLTKNCHPNTILQNSWNKYGKDSFEFVVIEECSREELHKRENYWCKYTKSHNRQYGYNLTITTDSSKYSLTKEGREKIGNAHRGKKVSDETRVLMSIARKGIRLSEETKRRMSEFQKGRKWSENRKAKFSLSRKGKGPSRTEKWLKSKLKPVVQYTLQMVKIEEFGSVREASQALGLNPSNIVSNCKDRRPGHVGGYYFKYK